MNVQIVFKDKYPIAVDLGRYNLFIGRNDSEKGNIAGSVHSHAISHGYLLGFDYYEDAYLDPFSARDRIEKSIERQDDFIMVSNHPTALDAFDLFDDEQRIFVCARTPENLLTVKRLQFSITRDQWVEFSKGKRLSEMVIEGAIF